MGKRRISQGAFFYRFSLKEHVPADHLLRFINRFVDFNGVRPNLASIYPEFCKWNRVAHSSDIPWIPELLRAMFRPIGARCNEIRLVADCSRMSKHIKATLDQSMEAQDLDGGCHKTNPIRQGRVRRGTPAICPVFAVAWRRLPLDLDVPAGSWQPHQRSREQLDRQGHRHHDSDHRGRDGRITGPPRAPRRQI
jgi:hypothetical protein